MDHLTSIPLSILAGVGIVTIVYVALLGVRRIVALFEDVERLKSDLKWERDMRYNITRDLQKTLFDLEKRIGSS